MLMRSIAGVAALAALAGVALGQGSLFPVSYWYPVVDAPKGAALADVDGDGILDYLVANYYKDEVSVFLGTGGGLFNALQPVLVAGQPRSLAVVDLNGDNKPDLVTVNSSLNHVAVLLGDGAGGFGTPTLFLTGTFPVWIDAGDLNGDGHADIVTADQTSATISVLLGDGLGGLAAPISQPAGGRPERIQLADMNLDGNLDCVSANWLDNSVSVLLGDGSGNLLLNTSVPSPGPLGLAVGDVSADGRPDVVVASSQVDHVFVFLGTANGGLAAPTLNHFTSSNHYLTAVMITEANGDGRPDLICVGANSKTLTVFIGEGGGSFGFALSSPVPESSYDAVAGNLNGDGFADVVTANFADDSIRVHLGDGLGTWEKYCTPKVNSAGCVPTIWVFGTPSVSNPRPFQVLVLNALTSKVGLFLYTVNGSQVAIPFQGGTLCLGGATVRRTPAQDSGFNPHFPADPCKGIYALDFNGFASGQAGGNPSPGLLVLGNSYQLQAWSRDPGFAPPNNTGLSAALDVTPWQ